ncbi:hypothetical protein [Embleya sp. NPDC005575]|uniref:hypothetical protein n=1 Tax=Embleya sp. NPDC005575 TaxID=3156892 RepID=UPI0033ABEF9D
MRSRTRPPGRKATTVSGRQSDPDIADRLHRALVRGYALPDTDPSCRRARLGVGVRVAVAANLLDFAFRERPDGDPEILADAALMRGRFLVAPSPDA